MSSIRFLGAAGTVTGSRHLVEHRGSRILLDCGLFQGRKDIRQQNWDPFPVPAESIDCVVLSHAHIDHSGWLPRLVKEGFKGPIICTPATRDLAAIMLPDSGRLQEEEARYANKRRFSKHSPALPLYTDEDALAALDSFEPLRYERPKAIAPGVTLRFRRAGHILGSAIVQLDLEGEGAPKRVVYSGDLGRYGSPIIPDPEPFGGASYLLLESTYGDRLHEDPDPRASLARIVREIIEREGVLLIPSFAIGRTQDLLYHLRQLQLSGDIPSLPIYVDSPMACDATPLYLLHREEHDDEMVRLVTEGRRPLQPSELEFVRGREESIALNSRKGPMIVLSASGMATGGRVLHHLKSHLPDPRNIVLFVGYQAVGSRGAKLLSGDPVCRIHGQDIPVRASIRSLSGFSAHADHSEIDRWLADSPPPKLTFCVHGEPDALETQRVRLETRGWKAMIPEHLETVELE